jgi:hypothetical protein
MRRRKFFVGIGAIVTGSGVLTTAGASLSTSTTPDASIRVMSARDLVVSKGDAFDTGDTADYASDTDLTFGELSPSELPKAYVNDKENDSLSVDVAIQADSSISQTLDNLLEITNNGDYAENVGINYTGYGSDLADNYGGSGDGELDKGDAQEIFQFKIGGTRVSPDPTDGKTSENEYANTVSIGSGNSKQVSLETSLTSDQVTEIVGNSSPGEAFGQGSAGSGVEFLTEIKVGSSGTGTS